MATVGASFVDQKKFFDVVSTITIGDSTWDLRTVQGFVLIDPKGCGWTVLLDAFSKGCSVELYEGDVHRFTMQGMDDIDVTSSLLASGCFTARVHLGNDSIDSLAFESTSEISHSTVEG